MRGMNFYYLEAGSKSADRRRFEVCRYLYPDAHIENTDFVYYKPDVKFDLIVGNPPYSVGQGDANANAANLAYPRLDGRIRDTYAGTLANVYGDATADLAEERASWPDPS